MKTIYVTSPLVWRRRLVEILPSIEIQSRPPVSETILRLRRQLGEKKQMQVGLVESHKLRNKA